VRPGILPRPNLCFGSPLSGGNFIAVRPERAPLITRLPVTIGLLAAITTWCGGLFALRFRHQLNWLLCFSAGAVLGVAFFDLLPESRELCGERGTAASFASILAGCLTYAVVHRLHAHHMGQKEQEDGGPLPAKSSMLAAASLSMHSLLDGLGIGLAYKVSAAAGLIAAIGVLVHDFSDGINTIGVVLRGGNTDSTARRWLLIDSLSPVVGVLIAGFIYPSQSALGMLLGLFCGFFVYIGAFDLLPEGVRRCSPRTAVLFVALGAGVLYAAVKLASV
jgi:zinc transporter ZupT